MALRDKKSIIDNKNQFWDGLVGKLLTQK